MGTSVDVRVDRFALTRCIVGSSSDPAWLLRSFPFPKRRFKTHNTAVETVTAFTIRCNIHFARTLIVLISYNFQNNQRLFP
jgi:hypothetical protein